jgi:hypothetical protein
MWFLVAPSFTLWVTYLVISNWRECRRNKKGKS